MEAAITLREQLLAVAVGMEQAGLNRGSAGNASARCEDGFLITPTGLKASATTPEDLVFIDADGQPHGALAPSSEWRFHRDVYRSRPEARAILHAHAPYATALACQGRDIPPFHYMIARFGGATVRCADYATFGTQQLSDHILRALDGRNACLMANHGMLVFGPGPGQTLDLALEFETLCEQYWRTCQLGVPRLLDEAEMNEVLRRFRHYGQAAARSGQN